ncbi:two component transcriptional regulator, LuxR family [Collimonas sp. OK307]|uniref:response regulator transcription factor n=1 Tax=Collimonas sp. OK307 TaxID=1801620 RepID=UPI0008F457CC|nr:response regulator transcription factor [Collimonas sp. OK307]SFH62069.1 two component transcriptional regulator, LuxR family [Collimonas sp. OK307]
MGKILIVDDHPVIRMAVRSLLEREGHSVVAETNNGIDAVSLAKEFAPDLVVLDLTLPKLDGMEVIERLKDLEGAMQVLVLTSHNPLHFAFRCKMAGAAGYVWKQGDLNELVDAAKAILSGYTYFPNIATSNARFGDRQVNEAEQLASLSNREMVVLQYLAQGMLNKDIAERMLLSDKTVSTYKTRLLIKLNMNSLVELIEFAKRNGVAGEE